MAQVKTDADFWVSVWRMSVVCKNEFIKMLIIYKISGATSVADTSVSRVKVFLRDGLQISHR